MEQSEVTRGGVYWAFLANPQTYAIEAAIRDLAEDTWTTKNHDVRSGDRVIIWKAKGKDPVRGIVAFAEVISDPEITISAHREYWGKPEEIKSEPSVRIRYVLTPLLPLWVGESDDDVLLSLTVSRATGGSVFHVSNEQWETIVDLAGGWPSTADELEAIQNTIDQLARPKPQRGRGFQSSTELRLAVEAYAMQKAIDRYSSEGWRVEDVSATRSYDLHCTRTDHDELRVEVKGTTGDGSSVLLTPNEVEHARLHYPNIALFIVAGVQISSGEKRAPLPHGGDVRVIQPWSIEDDQLAPVGYVYNPSPVSQAHDDLETGSEEQPLHGMDIHVLAHPRCDDERLLAFLNELRANGGQVRIERYGHNQGGPTELYFLVSAVGLVGMIYLKAFLETLASEHAKALNRNLIAVLRSGDGAKHYKGMYPLRIGADPAWFHITKPCTEQELAERFQMAAEVVDSLHERKDGNLTDVSVLNNPRDNFYFYWSETTNAWEPMPIGEYGPRLPLDAG
jgi:hypothetical protein